MYEGRFTHSKALWASGMNAVVAAVHITTCAHGWFRLQPFFLWFVLLNLAGCRKTCQKKKQILTYLFITDSWLFGYSRSNLLVVCVIGIVRVDCSAAPLVQGVWGGGGGFNLGPKNTKHNNNNILDSIYYVKPSSQNLGKCIIMKIPTNWK